MNAALVLAESIAFLFATPQGAGVSCGPDPNGVIRCSNGTDYRRDPGGVIRDNRGHSWWYDPNRVLRSSYGVSCREDAAGVTRCF